MEMNDLFLTVLLLLGFTQLLYFLLIFTKWSFSKNEINLNTKYPISVVVCGYNEASYWQKLVDKLLQQDYPNYEIVLVDDQSSDNTKFIFNQWENHPKIKLVRINQEIKKGVGKKFALTLGIKATKYEHLLLTDADCLPTSNQWISKMAGCFSEDKQIVLGYGAYEKRKGLLNKLIRFDTFQVALQYFSYALLGIPYMGVGRNLAYKKSLFFDNKGFASHIHIPSGDDDLFIQEVANKNNVAIMDSYKSKTISVPSETFKQWIHQKSRHLSTSKFYKKKHQFLLAIFGLSKALFWLTFILMLSLQVAIKWALIIFFVRLLVQALVYFPLMKKTEENDLFLFLPILELFYLFLSLIFMFSSITKKQKFW